MPGRGARWSWYGLGLVALWGAALGAAPAAALDLLDGRLAVHGFYETQLRTIANDFSASDGWDLTQFAHVLNLEVEADLAPDGFGPFNLVSAFGRIEVRYDCVWTRACGIFRSANAFGDRAERLPKRLENGRRSGFLGAVFRGDTRKFRGELPEFDGFEFRNRPDESRTPFGIEATEAFGTLFTSPGADGVLGTADDPSPFYFARYFQGGTGHCRFSARQVRGPVDGAGVQNLGPLDPACDVVPNGAFADRPNPFRPGDINPLTGGGGGLALPYRPATEVSWRENAGPEVPRGLWVPNAELRRLLRDDELDTPPINKDQDDLAWNHGASQGAERELKELYVDLEMFESRLWLRLGKQTIVWGKTELFRNQDQFNPQDLALSSLPSLEESRTALWAARAIWSFYNVGPLEDVRLEVAMNYDQYEPADLGDCGEPYAVVLVCAGTFGFLAHGFEGLGLAGVRTPPAAWNSWKGLEAGARVEFRWDRFSFSVSDFYGYNDLPHLKQIFRFERNVDPVTGRPRRLNSRGECRTGREAACLGPDRDALLNHSANLTLFTKNCAATFGFISLDFSACGLSIFNSTKVTDPTQPQAPRLMLALTNVISGQCFELLFATGLQLGAGCGVFEGLGGLNANTFAQLARFPDVRRTNLSGRAVTPLIPLSLDVNDGGADNPAPDFSPSDPSFGLFLPTGLSPYLTVQQEALLGCGPFFATRCDIQGIDLLNAEASALFQAFVGFDGTSGDWDTRDGGVAQPGTVGFEGGPVCTRFERGRTFILPGCRGPRDRGYDPGVDGTTTGPDFLGTSFRRVQPFTGQPFRSEMAVLSWNLMMTLVGFSIPANPSRPTIEEFDADRPFRDDGCSFAKPQLCAAYFDFWRSIATKRNVVRAGGNGRYGRRDFQWHDGTPVYVAFDKRNILGFSMDFAEDLLKSNWSFEGTWVRQTPYTDNDQEDGLRDVDLFNLTISVDRPTFVNFLNANRTFFFNAQVFLQYVAGYREGFTSNGPWNALITLTATTGYFQDRLLPSATVVYDVQSGSGAFLPQLQYRFTENFSATFGIALFAGRAQPKDMALVPIATRNRTGRYAYNDFAENGLSVVRDRDEAFLRLRYTF